MLVEDAICVHQSLRNMRACTKSDCSSVPYRSWSWSIYALEYRVVPDSMLSASQVHRTIELHTAAADRVLGMNGLRDNSSATSVKTAVAAEGRSGGASTDGMP